MSRNGSDIIRNNGQGIYNISNFEMISSKTEDNKNESKIIYKICKKFPTRRDCKRYLGVIICGLTIWGSSWFLLKDAVLPGGYLFRMTAVVIAGYIAGHTLQRYTTLPPLVAMTLVGALYRNLGQDNFLENEVASSIDFHLRRIYPVIILTKGPLGWDWNYIKNNSIRVFSMATLPWIVECIFIAVFTRLLMTFSWFWGLHLGTILASVSPAVVVPTVVSLSARGLGTKSQVALLVANAGGLDTAFTEAIFGVVNAIIFFPASITYKIIKAILAIFVGIGLGIAWGILVDFIPEHEDRSAASVRSIIILTGGVLLVYGCGYLGWGGTAGVAVMVCAGTAATRWSRRGWPLNTNPVGEVYRVLWLIFEPMLFTLSGYHLKISDMKAQEWALALVCVIAPLLLRLLAAFIVAIVNEFTIKESLFIAITWIPKAIVEAVLVRVAADSLWTDGSTTEQDIRISKIHSNIIVMAIIITSTFGSALTTVFGPILLSRHSRVAPQATYRTHVEENVRNNSPAVIQCVNVQQ